MGRDAFRTATGVHAAAIIKAFRKNDVELADAVYSGVPAGSFGLEQTIEIGPMSGKSNVVYWLEKRGFGGDETLVNRILEAAKKSTRVLTDEEILALCEKTQQKINGEIQNRTMKHLVLWVILMSMPLRSSSCRTIASPAGSARHLAELRRRARRWTGLKQI